jgi:hypothetical protein
MSKGRRHKAHLGTHAIIHTEAPCSEQTHDDYLLTYRGRAQGSPAARRPLRPALLTALSLALSPPTPATDRERDRETGHRRRYRMRWAKLRVFQEDTEKTRDAQCKYVKPVLWAPSIQGSVQARWRPV